MSFFENININLSNDRNKIGLLSALLFRSSCDRKLEKIITVKCGPMSGIDMKIRIVIQPIENTLHNIDVNISPF